MNGDDPCHAQNCIQTVYTQNVGRTYPAVLAEGYGHVMLHVRIVTPAMDIRPGVRRKAKIPFVCNANMSDKCE